MQCVVHLAAYEALTGTVKKWTETIDADTKAEAVRLVLEGKPLTVSWTRVEEK